MKSWIDACTGKHVRYAHAIAERLRKTGHESLPHSCVYLNFKAKIIDTYS